jgi:hypothetical protein
VPIFNIRPSVAQIQEMFGRGGGGKKNPNAPSTSAATLAADKRRKMRQELAKKKMIAEAAFQASATAAAAAELVGHYPGGIVPNPAIAGHAHQMAAGKVQVIFGRRMEREKQKCLWIKFNYLND